MYESLSPETVERAKKGDSKALEELVIKFRNPLFFYALQYLGNTSDAEDITQEVLMKVIRALPTFKGQASIGTWIYKIMTNACIDFQRKKSLMHTTYLSKVGHEHEEAAYTFEPVDSNPLPDENYERLELQLLIKNALSQLSPDHRMTVILHDLHGFKYNEIAEITKASLGTVKSRLFYARRELRKILGPGFERGE